MEHIKSIASTALYGSKDVLTIRNKILGFELTLKDVMTALQCTGIHYDEIILLFCRGEEGGLG